MEIKIECQSCGGTGVYQGFAERDGASVICHVCNGTGCDTFTYIPFKERKKREGVKRVFLSGYGYQCLTTPITLDNGVFVDWSKEGVSYEEFLQGKMPKHIKHMGCPMIADQGACHRKQGFTDKCNEINGGWLSHIPSCKCTDKMSCWERFDNT